jgi:hypothetical protein
MAKCFTSELRSEQEIRVKLTNWIRDKLGPNLEHVDELTDDKINRAAAKLREICSTHADNAIAVSVDEQQEKRRDEIRLLLDRLAAIRQTEAIELRREIAAAAAADAEAIRTDFAAARMADREEMLAKMRADWTARSSWEEILKSEWTRERASYDAAIATAIADARSSFKSDVEQGSFVCSLVS